MANEKKPVLGEEVTKKSSQARRAGRGDLPKKKKTLGQKQFETYMAEKDTGFKKAQRLQKTYEGASPTIKADLEKRFKNVFDPKEMVVSSRRDTAKTFRKGGSVKKKKSSGAAIRGKGCEIK